MWQWGILVLLSVSSYGQVDHSPRWGDDKGSANSFWGILSNRPSYGIYDKEGINFGRFEYVKAGHWMGDASYDLFGYSYTGSISTGFENFSNTIGKYFRSPSSTSSEADLSKYYSSSGIVQWSSTKLYGLYRYNSYKYPIGDLGPNGYVSVNNTNITGLIILVHGHNDSGSVNPYISENTLSWISLRNQLTQKASLRANWAVIGYDWAEDANNGSTLLSLGEAAEKSTILAHYHGIHLAEALSVQFPNLQKIQIIAHSAGVWLARSMAKNIQDRNSALKVQITSLDPFIPTHVDIYSPLSAAKITELSSQGNAYILENYYAVDFATDTLGGGSTSQQFIWLSSSVQKRIDWVEEVTGYFGSSFNYYYNDHSGPIQWYADSIASLGATSSTPAFSQFRSAQSEYGWSKSLFMNEPQIRLCPSSLVVAPSSSTVITTVAKNFNNDLSITNTNDLIKSAWQIKDSVSTQWTTLSVTSSQVQFNSSPFKTNINLRYTAYNNAGSESRDLTIRVRSYYEQWAEVSNGLIGTNADALSDISGNGVPNIIKFALGKTPSDKSIPQYNTSTLASNSKKYLKISVPRTGMPTGVSIVPEVSSDLQTWKSTEAQTLTDTASEYSAQDLVPMDSATRRFIRLRFTEQ